MLRFMLLILVIVLFSGNIYAQSKWKFRSMNYMGVLAGSSGPAFETHSINGFFQNNWFAGVGLALDNYRFTSFPVYGSVGYEFRKKQLALVLSADGGGNFSEYSPGLYGRTGIGVKVYRSSRKSAFLVDLGYSYKQVIENLNENDRYNYEFSRISIRMGWQF